MTALALGRKGFDVLVLEEAEEFGVIGFGIQLGPNVFWMLDRLGVADAVLAKALRPKSLVMLRLDRWRRDNAHSDRRYSSSTLHASRMS